jgi:hypothetical protein
VPSSLARCSACSRISPLFHDDTGVFEWAAAAMLALEPPAAHRVAGAGFNFNLLFCVAP